MTILTRETCPDRDKHTVDSTEPKGYVAWHEWAAWMTRKGSKQRQCPTCQLWAIWAPTGEQLGYDKPRLLPREAARLRGRRAIPTEDES